MEQEKAADDVHCSSILYPREGARKTGESALRLSAQEMGMFTKMTPRCARILTGFGNFWSVDGERASLLEGECAPGGERRQR